MEKRDILVIFVAIIIVLIMAMYIKPLVTGKEAKLIPDEISGLFSNNNTSPNNENRFEESSRTDGPISQVPLIKSITPDTMKPLDPTASIDVIGENFKETMLVRVFSDSENKTYNITLDGGTLRAENLMLSEGNWTVKIVDTDSNVTYNTQHIIQVIPTPTPVPTWDGKSHTIVGELVNPMTTPTRVSVYTVPTPQPFVYNDIILATLEGNKTLIFEPLNISTGYWKLSYSVNYTPNLANPTSDDIFEFNKQYKESAKAFEGEPEVIYDSYNRSIDIKDTKSETEIEKKYSPSSEKVLIKKPVEGWKLGEGDPFTVSEGTGSSSLVETVSYGVPDITIIIRNLDHLERAPIIVKPAGGIDPLQWNEALHKQKADIDLKQKGLEKSPYEEDMWKKKWESIKDPRPWIEKIYGYGSYSLEVIPNNIEKYSIDILIPTINTTNYASNSDLDNLSISKSE
ncbi:hypothetical protein [Methanospirillum sp.]